MHRAGPGGRTGPLRGWREGGAGAGQGAVDKERGQGVWARERAGGGQGRKRAGERAPASYRS
ncbi:hypothetical protein SSCG_03802 [Streptomyces clavuligerus]|nr:hypothetical protein SSCG_03802 [Streptomyces clavuligerus]